MTDKTTLEGIVGRLSEAQKVALVKAKPSRVLKHEHWTPARTDDFTLTALRNLDLIWFFTAGSNPITPLGLEVRALLMEAGNG